MGKNARVDPARSPPGSVRLGVIERHAVVRAGLVTLLEEQPRWTVTLQCAGRRETVGHLRSSPVDLVVVGTRLADGHTIDLIQDLRAFWPATAILVFAPEGDIDFALRTLRAGAHGFVTATMDGTEISSAARDVLAGRVYFSLRVLDRLRSNPPRRQKGGADANEIDCLSDREFQVLEALGEGLPTAEVGQRLGVSAKTVGTYVERLKEKLGVRSYRQLLRHAVALSLKAGE